MYTTEKWLRYGLGIVESMISRKESISEGHDLVADYLDRYPDVRTKYSADQRGEIKYYDVIKLAEKEAGL